MWFTSDYAGPAAPQIIDAVVRANTGYDLSYGEDAAMGRVTARVREIFEAPDAAVYLVATGTAANALILSLLCPPWATIYCHHSAHAETDECAAPEFYTGGAKLTPIAGSAGRIDAGALLSAINATGIAGVHNVQKGALSLTNATEHGTIYSLAQLHDLTKIAHDAGIPVHLDGARLANALVSLSCTPAEASWKAGIDMMSLGGTKNGLLGGELVILFDPARAWEFELRRKRGGHLLAKQRHLSAQFEAYLTDGLWLKLAGNANRAAQRLAGLLATRLKAKIAFPTEANAVFAVLPRAAHRRATGRGAQYYLWPGDKSLDGPDDEMLLARFVCSWSTSDQDIDALIAAFQA